MSGSLNKVLLIGNLGKDPELKVTPSGQPVAKFSVATTETWKNPQGEKQSKTEWHNIVVWGKQAEIAEKYLRKGKQILVEGRIQYREYTDQAGVKKFFTEIRCDHFVMLGRMEEGGGQREGGYSRASASPVGAGVASNSGGPDFDDMPPPPPSGGYDDDIPF
ncbi:MAG: single-stranded DNA-binding protein [Acidobacteriota bacterium]|nr:single-stranded DNA-binding protein [Acidobacteriota bacterium]